MKKESFANKMARKAFEKDDVKKSWETHVKAFGPILEPALENNLQARQKGLQLRCQLQAGPTAHLDVQKGDVGLGLSLPDMFQRGSGGSKRMDLRTGRCVFQCIGQVRKT